MARPTAVSVRHRCRAPHEGHAHRDGIAEPLIGYRGSEAAPDRALAGKRILVVEDQHLIAEELAEVLGAAECIVVGPVPSLSRAESTLDTEAVHAAVLDINLDGTIVWQSADTLRAQLVLASGNAETIRLTPR